MTYEFKILNMQVEQRDGMSNYVSRVDYRYSLTENDKTVSSDLFIAFPEPSGGFTPYEQLDEATVMGWLEATCDIEVLNNTMRAKMDALNNPPQPSQTSIGLPWATVAQE